MIARRAGLIRLAAAAAIVGSVVLSNVDAFAGGASNEGLAKQVQNPVANMISVPFQNNTNLNYGPDRGVQNIMNFQPVVPFNVSPEFNVITRSILPIVANPSLGPRVGAVGGLGDLQFTPFLSPAAPSKWVWGVGPIIQFPTHTAATLGNDNLGLGPSVVLLHLSSDSPWVVGALVNTLWSLSTAPQAPAYTNSTVQPFVNYNFTGGYYLTFSPIVTMAWRAPVNQQLTLPLGGGGGTVFHLGNQPINAQVSGYYNVVRPDYGPNWQIRAQISLLFPK